MKKLFLSNISSVSFNLLLLIMLLIGIQNNHISKKIRFLNFQSFKMPISLIVGSSFIFGSLSGTFIFSIIRFKTDDKDINN